MAKIFVIAGNRAQADVWIRSNLDKRAKAGETTLSLSEYVYVDSPVKIRGFAEPHGVFIGTWRERKDMEEIFQTLLVCHSITDKSHRHINQLWGEWKEANPKPTPKLKPVAGGWINEQMALDHAAQALADDIDRQVLQQLSMKSSIPAGQLTPVIINAIQELKKEIDALKSEKG